jgi:hypothetical protein
MMNFLGIVWKYKRKKKKEKRGGGEGFLYVLMFAL